MNTDTDKIVMYTNRPQKFNMPHGNQLTATVAKSYSVVCLACNVHFDVAVLQRAIDDTCKVMTAESIHYMLQLPVCKVIIHNFILTN